MEENRQKTVTNAKRHITAEIDWHSRKKVAHNKRLWLQTHIALRLITVSACGCEKNKTRPEVATMTDGLAEGEIGRVIGSNGKP